MGIVGNEAANDLPERMHERLFAGPKLSGTEKDTYKKEFLEKEEAEEEKFWSNLPGMNHTKTYFYNIETPRSKRHLDLSNNQPHSETGRRAVQDVVGPVSSGGTIDLKVVEE